MEESSIGRTQTKTETGSVNGEDSEDVEHKESVKRARSDNCFTFMEVSIEPGIKSLKRLDSKKLKIQIKKWAKAVVTYARQVSDHFGSSRRL
ncbi:hypothetical protein DCAR_0208592 [Daucus carota subsp. sativus]|uniref:Uncharacterized protein n=1 Tax=Daucus carota subsp. sativus TaxID=79200 RepID=A0AAF1AN66_DAUCS|nr:hypothetical protein DCAR_0208592 [Daucus carota subsp. sativus]